MADPVESESLELPIEWYLPDSIVSRYATNMVVQRAEHEFIISFFEVKPPLILGEISATNAREKIGSVRAECIARVVIAKERMPKFVEALQTNLGQHLSAHSVAKEESDK